LLLSGCGETATKNNGGNGDIGSAELRQRAEAALQNGTTIIDPANDWVPTGNSEDNPSFYPYDVGDITSETFVADDNYLYIKIQTAGVAPTTVQELPTFNGDQVKSITFDITLDTDNNTQTGVLADNGAEVFVSALYKQDDANNIYFDGQSYWYGPTGTEEPEMMRYKVRDYQTAVKWGGFGYDWKIIAIPLKDIGISKDQEITVSAWAEVGSVKYDHASFDILGKGIPNIAGSYGIKINLNAGPTIIDPANQ
jgi:hypothetical protein